MIQDAGKHNAQLSQSSVTHSVTCPLCSNCITFMCDRQPDWVGLADLVAITGFGRDAIIASLNEFQAAGLVKVYRRKYPLQRVRELLLQQSYDLEPVEARQ